MHKISRITLGLAIALGASAIRPGTDAEARTAGRSYTDVPGHRRQPHRAGS